MKDMWEVLVLFLIPIGGGIPAGVLLAKSRGIEWPFITLLYFISDLILACLFEPVLKVFVLIGRRVKFFKLFADSMKKTVEKSIAYYGNAKSPLALVIISFGVDPMTGRSAAIAAGHGFFSGWLIAITGDMFYFILLMVCTLWLKSVLGDGNTATAIIFALMLIGPYLFRKLRGHPKQ